MTTTTTLLIWILVFLTLGFASLSGWAIFKLSANKKQEDDTVNDEDDTDTTNDEDDTDTDKNGEGTSDTPEGEVKPCACTEKGSLAKATANSEEIAKMKAEQEKTAAELKAMLEKQAKTAAALARLNNPDITSKIEANEQIIEDLQSEIRSQVTIKAGAEGELPTLERAITAAQETENKAAEAYSIEKKKLDAAEEALRLAKKRQRELPHNATEEAKNAAQAKVTAAETAVANAEGPCQQAKYAYEETFEKTDPKTGKVIERTLCAKDLTKAAIAARDAAVEKAKAAQDEIDRISGKIERIKRENAVLEAKLNG